MRKPDGPLRYGWTTGACAAAAAKSACHALIRGDFLDPVQITLPRGETPAFALARREAGPDWALAGIVKDAGDDPDVTHQALICAEVRRGAQGVRFFAGNGVGVVTKPGLPIPPGAPAINPVPRQMITQALHEIAPGDYDVTISVPGGEKLAKQTWNPRLGIEGGISILGTTGIVRPFSCAAWIASIHRGVDVARAAGLAHVCGATGATSERIAQAHYGLPDHAMLDMGDFAGGLLKYLRKHPVARLTIAGGFGKLTKLAQGAMDLHSGRSQVDFGALARLAGEAGATEAQAAQIAQGNTAAEALEIMDPPVIADAVAHQARERALGVLGGGQVDVLVIDRARGLIGRAVP